NGPMTLTLVLARDDPAGFARYLRDVYDEHSAAFRRFLTPLQVTDRFGPSRERYAALLRYLTDKGFTVVEGSTNRLTLTVRGARVDVERVFDVRISDYRAGDRTFYANDRDPALPAHLASSIQAVVGLSSFTRPSPSDPIVNYGSLLPLTSAQLT